MKCSIHSLLRFYYCVYAYCGPGVILATWDTSVNKKVLNSYQITAIRAITNSRQELSFHPAISWVILEVY